MRVDFDKEIIVASREIIGTQKKDGSFPAGSNGPHGQPETSLRVTSHWLIAILHAYALTDDNIFFESAKKAVKYILRDEHRPYGKTFKVRGKKISDWTNGIIGQAWILEALGIASIYIMDHRIQETIDQVTNAISFEDSIGLWKIVDIDGELHRNKIDTTFNHQIWYARTLHLLNKIPEVSLDRAIVDNISRFDDNFYNHISYTGSYYSMMIKPSWQLFTYDFKLWLKATKLFRIIRSKLKGEDNISIGYHSYHMIALSPLVNNYRNITKFVKQNLKADVELLNSSCYKKKLIQNKYGIYYNFPGVEYLYISKRYESLLGEEESTALDQNAEMLLKFVSTENSNLYLGSKYDPITYASRIYEYSILYFENKWN